MSDDLRQRLLDHARALWEAADALRVTASEDMPVSGRTLLAERVADDATGIAADARHLRALASAATFEDSLPRVERLLAQCNEAYQSCRDHLVELADARRWDELRDLAERRPEQWPQWCETLVRGLADCTVGLDMFDRALHAAWQDLAVRAFARPATMTTSGGPA